MAGVPAVSQVKQVRLGKTVPHKARRSYRSAVIVGMHKSPL